MTHAMTKSGKLTAARRLYFLTPEGLTDIELAHRLAVDRASAYRYRKELQAIEVSDGRYTLVPSQEDIDLAQAILQGGRYRHGTPRLGESGERSSLRICSA